MSLTRSLRVAATFYVASIVLLFTVHLLAPQRSGPLALTQIVAPHLFLVALLAVPLALRSATGSPSRRVLRLGLGILGVIALFRFGPGLVSLPAGPPAGGTTTIEVLSWNLEYSGPSDEGIVSVIADSEAAVVGLQELDPHDAALLASYPEIVDRYPYRDLRPEKGPFGSGLLSAFPIIESGWLDQSNAVWARLDLGDGRTLVAVTAHPPPGRVGPPSGFDPSVRDAAIGELRGELVDELLADRELLVLFGDFNVTDREPAFGELSSGLVDAHQAVGLGPGSTWRPGYLEWLPFGLLRIDHVFTRAGIIPLRIATDCSPRGSDHCIVQAVLQLPRAPAAFPGSGA